MRFRYESFLYPVKLQPGKSGKHQKKRRKETGGLRSGKTGFLSGLIGGIDEENNDEVEKVTEHRSSLLEISIFFTVDASAVGLPIQFHLFGNPDALFPAFPEVGIVKGYPHLFAHRFADGPDLFMFLEFAVEKGGGEAIEFALFGKQGGGPESVVIAIAAPVFLPERHISDEFLHLVTLLVDDVESGGF